MAARDVCSMAAELEKILREETGLVLRLYQCVCAEEDALTADRLDYVQRAVENQENLAAGMESLEQRRVAKVEDLAVRVNMADGTPSLHEIAERLEDANQACRLNKAGQDLSSAVERLHRKNQAVRGILDLRGEYTGALLNLIAGASDIPGCKYGARGQVLNDEDPGPGMYEVTI